DTVVSSIYAKLKLRLLNQKNTNHVEKTFWQFYASESGDSYGGNLNAIVLEAAMLCVSQRPSWSSPLSRYFSSLHLLCSSCLLMFQNVLLSVYVCVMCCLIMDQLVSK
ncbi:unnamed protein product, partial [Brassica oleracea]